MALTAARPIAPPTWRLVLIKPDATPASDRSTPVRPAIVTGTNEKPMPAPPSTNHGKRFQKYRPSTGSRVSAATEIADASRPTVRVVRTPRRPTTACATFDMTTTDNA